MTADGDVIVQTEQQKDLAPTPELVLPQQRHQQPEQLSLLLAQRGLKNVMPVVIQHVSVKMMVIPLCFKMLQVGADSMVI
jgi:hypothetical protein